MFYKFLAAFIAASALIYLGQLSVWVSVLGLGLKSLLAMIAMGIAGVIGWRLYSNRRPASKGLIEHQQ